MASIKKINTRKYKITVSNGYRPDGRKISRAKTITVPQSVGGRGIEQYVAHEAEEFERTVKSGYSEDGEMKFEEYALRWLDRQTKYAPSTLASYRRMLERTYPYIGAIKLNRLRPVALENMMVELRKRKCRGKVIQEKTVQKYLTVVSAVLSDAKRNEIISKNPARMIDLPLPQKTVQRIPTIGEVQKLLDALAKEPRHYRLFYLLSMYTGVSIFIGIKWSWVIGIISFVLPLIIGMITLWSNTKFEILSLIPKLEKSLRNKQYTLRRYSEKTVSVYNNEVTDLSDKLEAATKEKCAAESDLRRERAKLDSYSVDISILGD